MSGEVKEEAMRQTFAMLRPAHLDDASYFRARALQEQVAAQKATCEAARESHDRLAAMYRFRALLQPAPPEPCPEDGWEPIAETAA